MFSRALPALVLVVLLAPGASTQPDADEGQKRVKDSVDRALLFLQRVQEADGSWTARDGKNAAITGLAVMAFLSAGHVPGEGPYADTLERGVRWVLSKQQPNGLLATTSSHEMYHHGICTLMLAEVAGMTQGKLAHQVKQKLEKAVALILQAQRTGGNSAGGWRYRVNSPDADMSITGWQLLALRAAKNLGCDVPAERIESALNYVRRSFDARSGGFSYTPGGGYTIPCTGTGILCLEICGKGTHLTDEAKKAGALILRQPPRWNSGHFFYAVYYCSQATFQLGGRKGGDKSPPTAKNVSEQAKGQDNNYWNIFRQHLHGELLKYQQPNGAWIGTDGYGPAYGTAMSVLALTVEYRFLPIYQRGEEPTPN
ncbi:MAG: terpene cyclase/mutase family protein [Gemmataceae bacterium]|nr:terpene cyclase/mutase family protein [Gemmataceae bacterium]